jgi:excisionase family DNA binding protein
VQLLEAKEVAKILQISTQRVYELTRQGVLPSVRIGARQIRFEETRVLQWIENGGGLDAGSSEDYFRDRADVTTSKARLSNGRRGGNAADLYTEERKGSPLHLDELRQFEPIRFVLECTLRWLSANKRER